MRVACEPRHVSWFTREVDQLLANFQVARVAVDPALIPDGGQPGGSPDPAYFRLHGSPRLYYSAYPIERLWALARTLIATAQAAPVWCIFNNTAMGAATINTLTLLEQLPSLRSDS